MIMCINKNSEVIYLNIYFNCVSISEDLNFSLWIHLCKQNRNKKRELAKYKNNIPYFLVINLSYRDIQDFTYQQIM